MSSSPRHGEPSQRPFVPGFRNHLNGRASYRLRRQKNSQVLLIAILRVIVPGFGSDSDSQVRKGIEVWLCKRQKSTCLTPTPSFIEKSLPNVSTELGTISSRRTELSTTTR